MTRKTAFGPLGLRQSFANAINEGNLELVSSMLYKGGTNLATFPASDGTDDKYWRPLVRAAYYGKIPIARALLRCGAKLQDWDVLTRAVAGNQSEFLRFLAEEAEFDFSDKDGGELSILAEASSDQGVKEFLLEQSAKELAKAGKTLLISNYIPTESNVLKIELGEVFAMDNVTHIENPENISDLRGSLEAGGDKFGRVFVTAHGGPGKRISTTHLTQDEGDVRVEISEVIKILNKRNNFKEIHFFACHAGAHFGEEGFLEQLEEAAKFGQVIFLHSDEKRGAANLNRLRIKSAAKNNLSPIANAILASPEAINVFVRSQSPYSGFSSTLSLEIFSKNPETEISTANLGKYIKDQVARAQKFEAENGIKSDPEIDQRLKNLTTEENLQKYLSRLFVLSIQKISTPKKEQEFIDQWSKRIDGKVTRKIMDVDFYGEGMLPPLYVAAELGHAHVVEAFLKDERTDPNKAHHKGIAPLYIAAQNGHNGVVELLLKNEKTDPNLVDKDGWTALMIAAERGHAKIAELLLENPKTNPNLADKDVWTALMSAAEKGHTKIVELLLKNKEINPNLANKNGLTALMIATRKGDTKIAELLLENEKTDPNLYNKNGLTALMIATGKANTEALELLLKNEKTDPNLPDKTRKGDAKISELLLENEKINPNLYDKNGLTALMIATGKANTEALELLLKNEKTDPNLYDKNGMTALMLAQYSNHGAAAKLIGKGIQNFSQKNAPPFQEKIAASNQNNEAAQNDPADFYRGTNEVLQVVLGVGQMLGVVKSDSKPVVVEMTHPTSSEAQCFDNPPPIPSVWNSYSSGAKNDVGITYSSKDLTEEPPIPPQNVKPKDVTQVSGKDAEKTGGKGA